jgi:hypothetical protein
MQLRQHRAPQHTPLATVNQDQIPVAILPCHITQTLRSAVQILGPGLGFLLSDVSARCLRVAGATDLLCANVDSCHIELLGCWHSDNPSCENLARKCSLGETLRYYPTNWYLPSSPAS